MPKNLILKDSHPLLTLSSQVRELCTPLIKHTPIVYFDYAYYDLRAGSYYGLNTHDSIGKKYLENILYPNAQEFNKMKRMRYGILSPDLDLPPGVESEKFRNNIQMSTLLGVTHRFYILKITDHSVEHYGFGTSSEVKSAMQFFINNLEILENFATYFESQSQSLILECKKKPLTLPGFTQIIENPQLIKYPFIANNKRCLLSEREYQCLLWLCRNKTAKETAKILQLSPRTIEDYLTNIKNKLGCSSKKELLEIGYKNLIFLNRIVL